jgi:hypothetical protein
VGYLKANAQGSADDPGGAEFVCPTGLFVTTHDRAMTAVQHAMPLFLFDDDVADWHEAAEAECRLFGRCRR